MLETRTAFRGKQRNVDDSRRGGGEEGGEDEWRLSTAEKQTRGRRQRATDCDQQRGNPQGACSYWDTHTLLML